MTEEIEEYLLHKRILENTLKKYVTDKEIPLQQRWDLFLLSDLGEEFYHVPTLKSYNLYDFCHTIGQEWQKFTSLEIIDFLKEEDASFELIKNVKEELLELFIKSFYNSFD